jgi:3-phenylpropionate/trans-cinnamate dioxygenase ferredoxin reductase subunit
MQEPIVIIGAGQAALKCAETLRRLGFDGPLRMVGDEPHPPYQRPPLSKKFLSGDCTAEQLWLAPAAFFDQNAIELMTGAEAIAIDRARRSVALRDGRTLPFGRLLMATGSRPRSLTITGARLPGVHALRSIDDVVAMRSSLGDAARIVIMGGGYIGLEVAAVLRTMSRDVTVLEAQDRLLQRVVSPEVSHYFAELHRAKGVRIFTGATVEAIVGRDRVEAVETGAGRFPADIVLVAIGSVANDDLATSAGLETANGIVVDAACHSADGIYAAGDCARFPSRRYGTSIRLESVQNAADQGRAAAAAMLGASDIYDPVPWFWSDQYDTKLQIAGLSLGHDRISVDGDPSTGTFAVNYFAGDRLLAVDAINAPRAHMMARRQMA